MLRLWVDFNRLGEEFVIVALDSPMNSHIDKNALEKGLRVVVYDEELQYDAIMEKPIGGGWWHARILPETIEHYS